MPDKVNLDALIRRADFEIKESPVQYHAAPPSNNITVFALEPEFFFAPYLRKPDFQRETCDWSPIVVAEFIESFVNGDLVLSL